MQREPGLYVFLRICGSRMILVENGFGITEDILIEQIGASIQGSKAADQAEFFFYRLFVYCIFEGYEFYAPIC